MLNHAKWTPSRGYNNEKGRGSRNVNIEDQKTHSFNETGRFRRVSQLLLSMTCILQDLRSTKRKRQNVCMPKHAGDHEFINKYEGD